MSRRVGTYIHLFPQLKRGRKILWEGKNREGMPFLDHFPPDFVQRKREDEMMVETMNGSNWRIEGVENLDSIVGMNPVGIVFSEYSQMKPAAWDLITPILLENDGWAGFNFTPRGKNHAFELYQMALTNPSWYCSLLTVEDTRRDGPGENGLPIITPAMLDAERREGKREQFLQQEYFCSFEAGSELQFIPQELIELALAREPVGVEWAPIIVGVDVGRNRDRSVILVRQGGQILEKVIIHPHQATDNPTQHLGGHLSRVMKAYDPSAVFIDAVGIGAGLRDYMHAMGYHVIPILGSSKPTDEAYFNLRAEMWGKMRDWLRLSGCLQRERDRVLCAELTWPQTRWKGDKEWLTPKDELEDDGETQEYVSPDEADALALTFAQPVTMRAGAKLFQPRIAPTDYDVLHYDTVRP